MKDYVWTATIDLTHHQMNMTLLPVILGHEPGGGSTRTVVHFAQEVSSGKFCKYDLGRRLNMAKYGQPKPPEYR